MTGIWLRGRTAIKTALVQWIKLDMEDERPAKKKQKDMLIA